MANVKEHLFKPGVEGLSTKSVALKIQMYSFLISVGLVKYIYIYLHTPTFIENLSKCRDLVQGCIDFGNS